MGVMTSQQQARPQNRKRTHKLLLYTSSCLTSVLCPTTYMYWVEGISPLPAWNLPTTYSAICLAVSCISLVFAYQNMSIKQYRTKYHQTPLMSMGGLLADAKKDERRIRERAAIFHSMAWLNLAHLVLVLVTGAVVPVDGGRSGMGRLVLLSVVPSFTLAFFTRIR